MTKRLVLRVSLVLLLLVGLQATHGAAAQAVAELGALACCAHDCSHGPAKPIDPSRCCGVASSHADAAAVTPAAPVPAPTLVATLPLAPPSLDGAAAVARDVEHLGPTARAAPIYLLTRALLI